MFLRFRGKLHLVIIKKNLMKYKNLNLGLRWYFSFIPFKHKHTKKNPMVLWVNRFILLAVFKQWISKIIIFLFWNVNIVLICCRHVFWKKKYVIIVLENYEICTLEDYEICSFKNYEICILKDYEICLLED